VDIETPSGTLIEGFAYEEEFIDSREERELLECIGALPLANAQYRQYVAKRRVASFGAGYDYDTNELTSAPQIPQFLQPLRVKAAVRFGIGVHELCHALVAEYQPGTSLGWHRDSPQFGIVIGVSLAAACRMRLRPYPPPKRVRSLAIELAPRSVYVLRGNARWRWQHSIPPTQALRYSITFRTIRGETQQT
jgi:alkylated DNA repair dioxygenase AlkB